ncbi:hypothetical protein H8958_007759 [Nasalis larvatus]
MGVVGGCRGAQGKRGRGGTGQTQVGSGNCQQRDQRLATPLRTVRQHPPGPEGAPARPETPRPGWSGALGPRSGCRQILQDLTSKETSGGAVGGGEDVWPVHTECKASQ